MSSLSYKWSLKDYPEKENFNVFTTFACGGGSTMGYKLVGLNVIGANDIDKQMAEVYKLNHNPKYYYLCDIRDMQKQELPEEFFNLDILDGSPPCSSFSMVGNREKDWGKEKVFTEGQSKQVLDDLFFYFLDLANKLQPKVIIAENVKGILMGNAQGYVKQIIKRFDEIGYNLQLFQLNGASMGLPQTRERVFFIGARKDLNLPKLKLDFNEKCISFFEATKDLVINSYKPLTPLVQHYWKNAKQGESVGKFKAIRKIYKNKPCPTLTTSLLFHYNEPRLLSKNEIIRCGSFPSDYNFNNLKPQYLIGMSVPPLMMAKIASEIKKQWLSIAKSNEIQQNVV